MPYASAPHLGGLLTIPRQGHTSNPFSYGVVTFTGEISCSADGKLPGLASLITPVIPIAYG